jgi:hypothetical protein
LAKQVFRTEQSVHGSGPETFQIEGDELEAQRFENAGELGRHGRIESTRQFLARDFDANDLAVMTDAELAKTEGTQSIFTFLHDG